MFRVKTRKVPKSIQPQSSAIPQNRVRLCRLESLKNGSALLSSGIEENVRNLAQLQPSVGKGSVLQNICFVTPLLPHPCELEIWNEVCKSLGVEGHVVTGSSEVRNFEHFASLFQNQKSELALSVKGLDSVSENHTFLSGLEAAIQNQDIVVAVGESSLSTFQAVKSRRAMQNRLVVWQNAPRPPHACSESRFKQKNGDLRSQREATIRKEVLKNCDVLLTFDKDSSNWAFLEDVAAQRIRRVPRGVNIQRFSLDFTASSRTKMRASLGLPEADFIFLQTGPLEIDAGALDTVYAFKNMLQSWPQYVGMTKLVFCGTGTAGIDIKQAVVELGLDEHIFFLNPQNQDTLQILGNQLSNLLPLCDALIHNPLGVVNSTPSKNLDCTYDVLCGLASGLTLVSNGNGWVGEWLGRFYKTFGTGNIHSQSKLMRESIEKQDRLGSLKRSVRMAIENEMNHKKTVSEMSRIFVNLCESQFDLEDDFNELLKRIEKYNQNKQYLDAIKLIERGFSLPRITTSQKAQLFRIIGDCFTKLGDLESGKENYLRSLDLDGYQARTFIGLGTVSLQEQNYTIAVPQFQRAIALEPKDDMANLGLGLAFEGLQELVEAHRWSVKACLLNPRSTVAIFNVVKLSYEIGEFHEARGIVERYVAENPSDINMKFALGGLEFKLGNHESAEKLMEAILSLDPVNQRALSLRQQILERKIGHHNQKKQA